MTRVRMGLNREWRFCRSDVAGAEAPDCSDRAWDSVGLPHSFSLPYFMSEEFYTGYGWYRRIVDIPPAGPGARWSLEFDGVFDGADSGPGGGDARAIFLGLMIIIGRQLDALQQTRQGDGRQHQRDGDHHERRE